MIVYHWHRLVTHGDMLAGGCPKVVILTHLPFAVEMWAQMGQITTQLGRTLVPCCQYNFNSGILASGRTRMAPKPSKTTTARWLAWNSKTMALAMKCQINNQLNPDLPQHKPRKNWSLPTTSQLHLFCTT